MPTILRSEGYRFFFYSFEPGEPAHIHVAYGSKVAKYWLKPVELARSDGFKAHELGKLRSLVLVHRDMFQRKWDEYHSQPSS